MIRNAITLLVLGILAIIFTGMTEGIVSTFLGLGAIFFLAYSFIEFYDWKENKRK